MLKNIKPDMSKIAGGCEILNKNQPLIKTTGNNRRKGLPEVDLYSRLLTEETCNNIIEFVNKYSPKMAPVSVQGLQEITDNNIGSHRATMWNEEMANNLWDAFKGLSALQTMECNQYTSTDWWQKSRNDNTVGPHITNQITWRAVGVSPMLRYMEYNDGGKHNCHYDAGFINDDPNYRTLKSFVLYLTTNDSGATRIIRDDQKKVFVWNRNHNDWDKEVEDNQVLFTSLPIKGSVLFFNHRVPHDVSGYSYNDEEDKKRIIIRGDLYYEKC